MRNREERATTDQAMAVAGSFMCNVDWALVSQREAARFMDNPMKGDMSIAFVKSGRHVFFGELTRLPVNRSRPYDPVTYPSDVWRISEEDERSLALTEIDPNQIKLWDSLRAVDGNQPIYGEENLRRFKEPDWLGALIRLDAKFLQMFWANKHLIPERWKEKVGEHSPFIFFDGTILSCGGDRISLYLHWDGKNWKMDFRPLSYSRTKWMLSAVLEQ